MFGYLEISSRGLLTLPSLTLDVKDRKLYQVTMGLPTQLSFLRTGAGEQTLDV